MGMKIALPKRTPGVIESARPDAMTACFIRFPLSNDSEHLVDIELSLSRGFDIRLDDGRVIHIAPGMGMRVSGCAYTREGFVSSLSELTKEALFTLIDPKTARLYTRALLPGTRVLVTLKGRQPKRFVSIKKVMFALETPDPEYH